MKKSILIIFVLFFSIGNSFSQANYIIPNYVSMDKFRVLDSAYLKCTFKLSHVHDTLNADKTREIDMQTLLIGNKMTKYFSQYMVDYCLYVGDLFKKRDKRIQKTSTGAQPIIHNQENGTLGYEIFKSYPDNKMTVTDLASQTGPAYIGSNYQYEDVIPNLKWEMKNDTSTILSYSCQKAITTFRGRTYEAWYTTEIPINNGPWKFGGLPGLILKVSDKKQYFVFECIGIEKSKKLEPIKFYDLKYLKISRLNLAKLYQRLHDDYMGYSLSAGYSQHCYVKYPDGKVEEVTHSPKQPYNPIELE